jgi:hypothetical protein
MVNHPSGIEDEGELAGVSAQFWLTYPIKEKMSPAEINEAYSCLLSFQQGYQYCKEQYKIND